MCLCIYIVNIKAALALAKSPGNFPFLSQSEIFPCWAEFFKKFTFCAETFLIRPLKRPTFTHFHLLVCSSADASKTASPTWPHVGAADPVTGVVGSPQGSDDPSSSSKKSPAISSSSPASTPTTPVIFESASYKGNQVPKFLKLRLKPCQSHFNSP